MLPYLDKECLQIKVKDFEMSLSCIIWLGIKYHDVIS